MNFFIHIAILLSLAIGLNAKTVEVKKVFGSSPPMNYLLYALNPKKMLGLNFAAKNQNNFATAEFLDPYFLSLPVIGTFHSTGGGINLETLLMQKPDLILVWEDDMMVATVSSAIKRAGFTTLTIPFRKITDMPDAILSAAKAIDEEQRGKLLSNYTQQVIDEIQSTLKDLEPTRYYYAEGVNGLATECNNSFHVEALNFAGGENVHKCTQSNLRGLEAINIETLYNYDPEVIIAQNTTIAKHIKNDKLFANLSAVKNKRIYVVPNTPFNWIDRPPSFMRVIGIQWLTQIFHPEVYEIDLNQKIKEFYKLFLHVEISDKQVNTILGEQK